MQRETSGIVTRPASVEDVPAIAEFQTTSWNEAYDGLVPRAYLEQTTVRDRELRWADRIGLRTILLAEQRGKLVGVASSSLRGDSRPGPLRELNSLYVAAGLRGAGIGARLVWELLGDEPAVVWAFVANRRGIAFYERCGFRLDGYEMIDEDTGLSEVRLSRSA